MVLLDTKAFKELAEQTDYLTELAYDAERIATEVSDNDMDVDDLKEYIQENHIHTEEVIYYSNAMEFLAENDPSLMESMELASDMGYETASLNSELLATLLKQSYMNEELEEITRQLEDCILEHVFTTGDIVEDLDTEKSYTIIGVAVEEGEIVYKAVIGMQTDEAVTEYIDALNGDSEPFDFITLTEENKLDLID